MGYVKGLNGRIPSDYETGSKLLPESPDVIEWVNDKELSNMKPALEIRVVKYKRFTNNGIYMRINKSICDQLNIKAGDSVMVGFNKNQTQFGIRKALTGGVKLSGEHNVLYASTCNPSFNAHELNTMWFGFDDEVTLNDAGFVQVKLVKNDEQFQQRMENIVWEAFLDSED